jgi:hypothetical protein
MATDTQSDAGTWRESFARVWSDPAYKKALMVDPRSILRQLGIVIPGGITVRALGSRGAPTDPGHTLLQFVLERGSHFAFFFMPSPLDVSAQRASYGCTLGSSVDDAVFVQRLRADADAALREIDGAAAGDNAAPSG